MFWGGLVFTSGWVMRCISSYFPGNLEVFIAQTVLILAGPPIYSAAEYNILGRLMHYLPMHAPLNPNRLVYVFIYLGAIVEALTAAGSVRIGNAQDDKTMMRSGAVLVVISVILQAIVECVFMVMVGLVHYRCARAKMLTSQVRTICIMLYGTSGLILLRCICRAIEKFSVLSVITSESCDSTCNSVLRNEWFLYAFEAAPMVIYTYWLNVVHPGRFLPTKPQVYLGFDKIERTGPGWIDKRSQWETFMDPFDFAGMTKGQPAHERFWLQQSEWPPFDRNGNGDSNIQSSKTIGHESRSLLPSRNDLKDRSV
ncbi:hypothetical protein FQN57_000575 [Myotisia sp. PD_48]|nr:hypothetical protein FQN57_000575 [Myotisia sp. PD_48]